MAAHGAKGVQIELDRELKQLEDIITLVRGGKLNKNQKTAIGALTVMDVHARDVVKNMVAQGVSNKNDFLWLKSIEILLGRRRPIVLEAKGHSRKFVD